MAKNNYPVITHTEIICLAIRALKTEVDEVRAKVPDTPAGFALFCDMMHREVEKIEILKQLYEIETGTKYVD